MQATRPRKSPDARPVVAQVHSFVRAGFLEARRGRRGEYRFSFQDLVLLRTAKGSRRRTSRPAGCARAPSPAPAATQGQPLSAVQIEATATASWCGARHVWNRSRGSRVRLRGVGARREGGAPRRASVAEAGARGDLTAEEWLSWASSSSRGPPHARAAYLRGARAQTVARRRADQPGPPAAARSDVHLPRRTCASRLTYSRPTPPRCSTSAWRSRTRGAWPRRARRTPRRSRPIPRSPTRTSTWRGCSSRSRGAGRAAPPEDLPQAHRRPALSATRPSFITNTGARAP